MGFSLQVMVCFDFPVKWIEWLKSIHSSKKISVLVKGSPIEEFRVKRRLRQGDPLSLLLFNIIVEILYLILEKADHIGVIKELRLGFGPSIFHLRFADDTIIFIENTTHSCKGIKFMLKHFEILSGLKINYKKSFFYTSKKDHRFVHV